MSQNRTTLRTRLATLLALPTLLLLPATPAGADPSAGAALSRPETVRPETTLGLQELFEALDYNWAQLEKGVPPIILEEIPADLDGVMSVRDKKMAFFMGLLPMILLANQEITREREELVQIVSRHRTMEALPEDQERLETIMARYGLNGNPIVDHRVRERLLRRVDTIPPSLVLAQAANESAWGTSRFARTGNNLFGEWTYRTGAGMVPGDRPDGETYEVRRFKSVYASIRSYMNNLNRNSAYDKLREIRERLRNAGQPVTGIALAHGLERYSERGEEYIREIQAMIRHNKLSRVNLATLRRPVSGEDEPTPSLGGGLLSTRARLTGQVATLRTHP